MTQKCYSLDGEDYSYDLSYILDGSEVGDHYFEANTVEYKASEFIPNIYDIMDLMSEKAYNKVGEAEDGFPIVSLAAEKELICLLKDWADRNVAVNFYGVSDPVKLLVTKEDLQ